MKATEALKRILQMNVPSMTTQDVAAWLDITPMSASQILKRLGDDHLILPIKNGLWGNKSLLKPYQIPQAISAPMPAAISLLTALAYYGMISQIPEVIFAVTLCRSKIYKTSLGTISLHHLQSILYQGYEKDPSGQFFIASREKALFDTLYLSRSSVKWFKRLPEVTFDREFKKKKFLDFLDLVKDQKRKTAIWQSLQNISKA